MSNNITKTTIEIPEVYQTVRDEPANIDSPTFWNGSDGQFWVIATAKTANALYVEDAVTGEHLKKVGNEGQFSRPNGVFVIDDYIFVVERDNHRVQVLTLPEFKTVAFFGENRLIKPYGIYINTISDSVYHVYITDNYETEDEQIPPIPELNRRIHIYEVQHINTTLNVQFIKSFGDTTDTGAIRITESIWGDPENNQLLIAEEDTSHSAAKVYDLQGNFLNINVGENIFQNQVEGITLYQSEYGGGFWIITDQSHTENRFHIFARKTFEYWGSFYGPNTTNTDGVWLTKTKFGGFEKGAFFAIHNDGNVSAFDLAEILKISTQRN